MSRAAYNEIDPKAAAWLRELEKRGLIAPGDVLEASIEDLTPNDLKPYTQVHFFAGIGVWSYALRGAGWPDDRPVWTGSCPCQPFSAAGKGGGFDDERHLWPAFHYLIDQCRPDVVFGEQVASKDGLGWLDLVQADLEGTGYASGAVDLCAAGVGAPHIRQRLWWYGERLDNAPGARHFGQIIGAEGHSRDEARLRLSGAGRDTSGLADDGLPEPSRRNRAAADDDRRGGAWFLEGPEPASRSAVGGLADDGSEGRREIARSPFGDEAENGGAGRHQLQSHGHNVAAGHGANSRRGPTNGLWSDADWLFCRDGKWRPVEPGTSPLAHGAPERVGRLRGYGNAIVAPAAQAFIEAYLEAEADGGLSVTSASLLSGGEGVFA
jgi:DNA (cytosine-5)-methyltransferase 1